MNKRLVIVVSLAAILVLAVVLIYLVTRNPNEAQIYIDPQTTVIGPEQNFTIDVRVSGASDLCAWEFALSWNSTVLDSPRVVEGTFFNNSGNTFFAPQVTAGYILVDSTLLSASGRVNGNGVLAIIQFHVSSSGSCSLHLYDATLTNSQQKSTVPTLHDGHFSTT